LVHVFGDDSDFVLAIGFAFVGDALQLLNFFQCAGEGLDIGFETARAAGDPRISKCRVTNSDFESSRWV